MKHIFVTGKKTFANFFKKGHILRNYIWFPIDENASWQVAPSVTTVNRTASATDESDFRIETLHSAN